MAPKTEEKVIVFGPTGNIGAVVAKTAEKYGSEVTLAMRDTSKAIRGINPEEEKAGKYKRVKADLSDAKSVGEAVKKSGAKAAFLYMNWGSGDHMDSTFKALKDNGIEHVVFLSSFTVPDKQKQMEKVEPADMISYAHTNAELSLAKHFDAKQYVALRPGYFATNVLNQKLGIIAGGVKIFKPESRYDYITPDDMGKVGGNVLSRGQRDGQNIVYLFSPDLLTQREAFNKVGKGLGKEINVIEANEEEGVESMVASGLPEPVAKHLVEKLGAMKEGEDFVSKKQLEKGQENVEKYAARLGVRLDDWVTDNGDLFDSKIEDVATAMPESKPEPEEPEEEEEEDKEGEEGEEGEKKEGADDKQGKDGVKEEADVQDKKGKKDE